MTSNVSLSAVQATAASPAAQRAELERAVGAVWAETLGIPEIDPDEDFFDLGGHSLLGLEIVANIRALLGADKFPIDIVRTPTIASMTDAILERLMAQATADPAEARS